MISSRAFLINLSTASNVDTKDMGTQIGDIKTPTPKGMVTKKGIPKSCGTAPGTS